MGNRRTFAKLDREVRACTLCAMHLPNAPRPIIQWSPKSRILIVGQAPGRKAHEAGTPFDDPSGDRLRDWLSVNRKAFYDPDRFALIPIGFCFPGTGKSGDLPPRPECAPAWRAKMLDELDEIRLTLVIGAYAQAWHLPEHGTVTETVAAWRDHLPGVVPLPHPSPRNIAWFKRNAWFEAELLPYLRQRVKEVLPADESE